GIALTTDQTAAAGGPPGHYRLGKVPVISDGRVVRGLDGALAGSAATMDHLVRQTASLAGLRRAVAMASSAPARALKLAGLGRIGDGLPADLVVLDESLRVRATLVGGSPIGGLLERVPSRGPRAAGGGCTLARGCAGGAAAGGGGAAAAPAGRHGHRGAWKLRPRGHLREVSVRDPEQRPRCARGPF